MDKYNSRKEVPDKYKWDLTEFFKDEEDFDNNYNIAKNNINKLDKYIGCTKDPNKLLEYLNFNIELGTLIMNLYVYAMLKNDEELGVNLNIERLGKIQNLYTDYSSRSSFFEPELLKLTKEEYNSLCKNEKLKDFKSILDEIFRFKDHILTEKEEIIISELTSAMDNYDEISSTMINSEHDYGKIVIDSKEEQIRNTNLRRLLKNKDKNIRKEVFEKNKSVLDQYGTTAASLLNSYVKENNTVAKLKNYNSSWDAHLFSLKLDNEVYNTLVRVVEKNTDKLEKYFKLFKNHLNLKELHQYDLSLDLNDNKKEYTIDEAISLVRNAISPLGEKYLEYYDNIINNHHIDFCEYKGKQSGGYNVSTNDKNSRILMSFNYDLESVSTIAHESGHNVNHQFIKDNNPLWYRDNESIVAEVASLTNECLLSSYLANNGKTKEEQIAGVDNIISVIISNLFGAVREAKIESDFYEYSLNGNTITKEYLDKLTLDSLHKYYGNAVLIDDLCKTGWVTRSHYYMNFYLYDYAFSISVACYVADRILKNDKDMLDKYLKFLTLTDEVSVIDSFKVLGIDLKDEKVYENAIKYFDEMINKLEKLLK